MDLILFNMVVKVVILMNEVKVILMDKIVNLLFFASSIKDSYTYCVMDFFDVFLFLSIINLGHRFSKEGSQKQALLNLTQDSGVKVHLN